MKFDQALEQVKEIGQYNDFEGSLIHQILRENREAIKEIVSVTSHTLGNSNSSPQLLILMKQEAPEGFVHTLYSALLMASVDEIEYMTRTIIRAWWD